MSGTIDLAGNRRESQREVEVSPRVVGCALDGPFEELEGPAYILVPASEIPDRARAPGEQPHVVRSSREPFRKEAFGLYEKAPLRVGGTKRAEPGDGEATVSERAREVATCVVVPAQVPAVPPHPEVRVERRRIDAQRSLEQRGGARPRVFDTRSVRCPPQCLTDEARRQFRQGMCVLRKELDGTSKVAARYVVRRAESASVLFVCVWPEREERDFFLSRRIVDGIWVYERSRPQLRAPTVREVLRSRLAREPALRPTRPLVDDLEVTDLVEEHVVQHEAPNGQRRPLRPPHGPERESALRLSDEVVQAHARRECAERDLATSARRHVPERAVPPRFVGEVDRANPTRELFWKPGEHDRYVFFVDVVPTIAERQSVAVLHIEDVADGARPPRVTTERLLHV